MPIYNTDVRTRLEQHFDQGHAVLILRPLVSAINERGQLAFVVNFIDGGLPLLLATPRSLK